VQAKRLATVLCPTVLLVGRSGFWEAGALSSLRNYRSQLSFAVPHAVTPRSVRDAAIDLLLLDGTVPAEQRKQFASELIGSAVSIFYAVPVEDDCWWVPRLLHGQDCHGAPAFRRRDFPAELERIFRQRSR
jgi:hypothetical protein